MTVGTDSTTSPEVSATTETADATVESTAFEATRAKKEFELRPYQQQAVDAVIQAWEHFDATLVVSPMVAYCR